MALFATPAEAASTAHPAAASPPPPQAVYRCGNSYSSQRCGDAAPLSVDDPRTAADRAQGAAVTAREKRLASTLEAQRRAREAPPPAPARAKPACSAASAASRVWSAAATPKASCAAPGKAHKRAARKSSANDGAASDVRTVTLPATTGHR